MQLLGGLALNLLPSVIAFTAGLLRRRVRTAFVFSRARQFWRPVMSSDLQLVLGGFGDLRDFEASGLVGAGDVLAMNELTSYFQKIGYGTPQISYSDQLMGDELRTNMIILGGPDANSMTRLVLDRTKLGIELVKIPVDELDQASEARKQNPQIAPPLGKGAIPVIRDWAEQRGSPGPQDYYASVKVGGDMTDYGVLIRISNPFEETKTVVILCGSHGYGTWAAVQFAQSGRFLSELQKIPRDAVSIECVLSVDVVRGSPQRLRPEFVRETPGKAP